MNFPKALIRGANGSRYIHPLKLTGDDAAKPAALNWVKPGCNAHITSLF